jgi:hypothetical protein
MKLRKALVAIALSLLALAASAAEVDPPAVIGRLNHVAGAVSFAPARAPEDWAAAVLNRPVTTGDRLWTDAGGRAELHVGSLAIRIDAQTSLDVLRLDDNGLQLRVAQGDANLRLRRGDQPVEIATPGGAVVLTRPGSYRVNVDPGGSVTSVAVRAGGQAEVFARNGSFLVSDGQQALIADGRQNLAAAPGPDEFDRWSATRDQREDRVASTRYVPAEMTGYEDLDQHGTWRTVPQYGTVWQPRTVPAGWAPYRHGHWVWVDPWGWTWVDDAPWGFAPSHYGRWVWLGNHWAWAPGRMVARPVYAPAVVAFIGGANFSVSLGVGPAPAVAWVPLGWREPYRPWYRASHAHLRNVNVTHVTNVTNITHNVTNVRLVNRRAPSAVTVVSRENFVAARAVRPSALKVSARAIAAAPVTAGAPVAAPERASLAQARKGARPPAEVRTREAVAVSAPPQPAAALRRGPDEGTERRAGNNGERPRVRVVDRQERVNPVRGDGQRGAPQAQAAPQTKAAAAADRPAETRAAQERPAEKTAAPAEAREQRRAAAPPAEVSSRPTFDRSQRPVAPDAGDPARERRQDARAEKGGPRQGEQRAEQQQAREQQAQERRTREQQEQRQRTAQQQERQQQAAQEQRQRAQPDQVQSGAQEQAQQRAQQQRQAQERAQERAQQRARQQAQEQAQQRSLQQQKAWERAQVHAQQRAQQEQQAEQRARQQALERAREEGQRQQQARQRAQQQARQAQQQVHERAQAQVQAQRQQQAREQARREQQTQQQAQERAPQQAQPQQARQQSERAQEKGGRGRRQDKSEKG